VAALLLAPGARAQEPPARLVVASISPYTDARHPLVIRAQVRNEGTDPLTDARVVVQLRAPVLTRSALRAALDSPQTGAVVATFVEPVPGAGPGTTVRVVIERRLDRVLTARGIYPASITLEYPGGAVVSQWVIPFFPPSEAGRLNVSVIVPLGKQPGLSDTQLARLTRYAQAIERHPFAAITIAPSPAVVDELAAGAGAELVALEAIKQAVAGHEVATVPYAPLDVRSLTAHRLESELLRQVGVGRSVLAEHLGVTVNDGFLVAADGAVDQASLAALSTLGVTGTLVDPSLLADQPAEPFEPASFGPSRPVEVAGGTVGLLPDEPLAERIAAGGAVSLANAIVAETLGTWQELPLNAPDRLIVMTLPSALSAGALGTVLGGLESAPWVRLVTASRAAETLPPQGEPLRLVQPVKEDAPYLETVRRARGEIDVLLAVVADPFPEQTALDRTLLLAQAQTPEEGERLAQTVRSRIDEILDGLTIAERHITLTSRTGSAPLSINNANPFPMHVQVRLDGGPRLGFPEGAAQVVELPAETLTTLSIPVEARSTGSYPIRVTLETPDGEAIVGSGRLILRSTAVSRVALIFVVGGGAFLLLASALRSFRGRRSAARVDEQAR